MTPKLQSSSRFINDYKDYQRRISLVTDENLKKELTEFLLKLRDQVGFLDRQHEQVFYTGRIPSDVGDIRADIVKYKTVLDQKLKAWEMAQLVKPAPRPNAE